MPAAGRRGAVRLVEFLAPLAEARIAAARDDATAAADALRRSADGARRVGIVMFLPAILASLACVAAIGGDEATAAATLAQASAALGGRRQAITAAALRYAEGVMAWHRGELAAARERYPDAARLLAAVAAVRPPAPPARPGTSSARIGSPRHGNKARRSPSATRWPTPPARAAVANDPPLAGPA